MDRGHYVYRYIYKDEIIYIGRTIDMDRRVSEHKREPHFKEFCKKNKIKYNNLLIEYITLQNSTEESVVEKILINKYKPELNTTDNHDSISSFIDFSINTKWLKYYGSTTKTKQIKKITKRNGLYNKNTKYTSLLNDWYMFFSCREWLLSYQNPYRDTVVIKNIPEIHGSYYLSYLYFEYGENNFIGVSFIKNTTIKNNGKKYTELNRPLCEIIKFAPLFVLAMNQIREKIIVLNDLYDCDYIPPYFNIETSEEQIHDLIKLLKK